MRVQITTNAPEVANGIRAVFRDQIPFALAVSTNALANQVQDRQRERQAAVFEIRRRRWADLTVKRRRGEDWATKANPTAVVRYESPGGGGREDILAKFEDERVKVPLGRSVAVPTKAVPRTGTGVIRKPFRPSNLEFRRHGKSGKVARGKNRTFLIDQGGGRGLILRRSGKGSDSSTEVLYFLRPQVDIDPDLEFHATANLVVAARADEEFRRAFDRAIGAAR